MMTTYQQEHILMNGDNNVVSLEMMHASDE